VRARLPHATVVLQLDEPSLPPRWPGGCRPRAGWARCGRSRGSVARDALQSVIEAADVPVIVHCCAPGVPLALLRAAGAAGLSVDLSLVDDLDALGETIDAGSACWPGSRRARRRRSPTRSATSGASWASRRARLPEQVAVTPPCGLPRTPAVRSRSC
jgi:hypothetical protein